MRLVELALVLSAAFFCAGFFGDRGTANDLLSSDEQERAAAIAKLKELPAEDQDWVAWKVCNGLRDRKHPETDLVGAESLRLALGMERIVDCFLSTAPKKDEDRPGFFFRSSRPFFEELSDAAIMDLGRMAKGTSEGPSRYSADARRILLGLGARARPATPFLIAKLATCPPRNAAGKSGLEEYRDCLAILGKIGPEAKGAIPTAMRIAEGGQLVEEVSDFLGDMGPAGASAAAAYASSGKPEACAFLRTFLEKGASRPDAAERALARCEAARPRKRN